MPTITERRNDDGTRSFVAQVRVKGFKAVNKTFHQSNYPAHKEAMKAAVEWADGQQRTLNELRKRGPGAVRADVGSIKLKELVEEYLKDPETKTLLTLSERERQLGWWVDNYGSVRALEFSQAPRLREAREKLMALHQHGTVNRYLAAARACVNWGQSVGIVPPETSFPKRLMLTEPKAVERFLSDEELAKVLDAAHAFSPTMYAAVVYAIGVGVRAGEQLRLCWGDIADSTSAIKVTKSDTSRRAHTPPAVIAVLKELRGSKAATPLPSVRVFLDEEGEPMQDYQLIDRWEKIRATAGVKDVRWHDLRHSCASILIQNGASLAEVASQLGHKNIATSKRYAHLVPGHKPTGADALNAKLARRR